MCYQPPPPTTNEVQTPLLLMARNVETHWGVGCGSQLSQAPASKGWGHSSPPPSYTGTVPWSSQQQTQWAKTVLGCKLRKAFPSSVGTSLAIHPALPSDNPGSEMDVARQALGPRGT